MRPQVLKHVAGIEVSGLFDLMSLHLTSADIISRRFVN